MNNSQTRPTTPYLSESHPYANRHVRKFIKLVDGDDDDDSKTSSIISTVKPKGPPTYFDIMDLIATNGVPFQDPGN